MSAARAVRIYTGAVFFLFIAVSGLFMAAGGLGLAASTAMIGLLWLPMLAWPALNALRRPPPSLVLFALFVTWAALSLVWSPYERPDQALKLLLLTPLFILFPYGVNRLDARRRERFAVFTLIVLAAAGAYFTIESLFGAPIATAVKLAEGAAPPEAPILAKRTISRGASAFILAAGPAALFLWLHRRRIAAGALLAAAALAAAGFDVDANIVALAAGAAAGGAAWLQPRRAVPVLLYAAAALILLTPLILSVIVALVSEEMAAGLPFSWHQRLEIWAYSLDRLSDAPFLGLGLDASRALGDQTMLRGHRLDLIPLHPHNGALHVWLETGAVGAGLAAAALLALARALTVNPLEPALAAGLAWCGAGWITLTLLGFGVWQEWHHGALSFAAALAFMTASATKTR